MPIGIPEIAIIEYNKENNSLKIETSYDDSQLSVPISMSLDNNTEIYYVKKGIFRSQPFELSEINIIGHRGNGRNTKRNQSPIENTLKSYKKAIRKGAEMIELDIHMTKDKKLVIFHDFKIKDEMIPEMSLDEFKHKNSTGETLEKVLKSLPKGIPIYIEIKYGENHSDFPNNYLINLIEEIIKLVLRYPTRKYMFASFSHIVCILFKTRYPYAYVLQLIEHKTMDMYEFLNKGLCEYIELFQIDGIVFDSEIKGNLKDQIKILRNINKILICYGSDCNIREKVIELLKLGVSGICTDEIEICKEAIEDSHIIC